MCIILYRELNKLIEQQPYLIQKFNSEMWNSCLDTYFWELRISEYFFWFLAYIKYIILPVEQGAQS